MATCATCNGNVADSAKFCDTCGASTVATASSPATSSSQFATPGAAPTPGNFAKHCRSCGRGLLASAVVCPGCGSAQDGFGSAGAGAKNKTVAVLLAVFLSGWSWLYTFDKNKNKFWIFLGLGVVQVIIFFSAVGSAANSCNVAFQNGQNCVPNAGGIGALAGLAWLIAAGVWLWAIIDNATKTNEWYARFPNG